MAHTHDRLCLALEHKVKHTHTHMYRLHVGDGLVINSSHVPMSIDSKNGCPGSEAVDLFFTRKWHRGHPFWPFEGIRGHPFLETWDLRGIRFRKMGIR